MKRNLFLRISVLLFVAVTATSGVYVGSGTFAKYTASAQGTAQARVALFKVAVKRNADTTSKIMTTESDLGTINLYRTLLESYDLAEGENQNGKPNTTQSPKSPANGTPNDVLPSKVTADTTDPIIAPGTAGYFDLYVENQSEVSVVIKLKAEEGSLSTTDIQFVAKNTNSATPPADGDFNTADSDVLFILLPAGVTGNSGTFRVWWRWRYYVSDAQDAKDTALGKVGTEQIKLNYTLEAIQID